MVNAINGRGDSTEVVTGSTIHQQKWLAYIMKCVPAELLLCAKHGGMSTDSDRMRKVYETDSSLHESAHVV